MYAKNNRPKAVKKVKKNKILKDPVSIDCQEKFIDVFGYESLYLVSNYGRIYSKTTNKILKQNVQSNGRYSAITLCKNNAIKTYRIHRIVAQSFISNPDNKPEVNHKDGNIFNNKVENLEWCTASENAKHSIHVLKNKKPPLNFLGKFGVEHNRSKCFWLKYHDGNVEKFGSGLEMKRKKGYCHSTISYARKQILKNNLATYCFNSGNLKGIELLINI